MHPHLSIHPKEKFYFALKCFFSLIIYVLIGLAFLFPPEGLDNFSAGIVLFYLLIFGLIWLFRMGYLAGYLRGNGVKVSPGQFPELWELVVEHCQKLGLPRIPEVYVLQSGGLLNAFATRFAGKNYVVIYSEIAEEIHGPDNEAVSFVLGHELGHLYRKHLLKDFLLFPSIIVPFLHAAWLRACEYTCDHIGAGLSPHGAATGILMLASGKRLSSKTKPSAFIDQAQTEKGFWFWFAEKCSSHPHLSKRLEQLHALGFGKTDSRLMREKPLKESDHSAYMPK